MSYYMTKDFILSAFKYISAPIIFGIQMRDPLNVFFTPEQ